MPEYLISNKSGISKYARIDGKGIAFVDQENATGFATPEAALKAFEKVVAQVWIKGKAKAKLAREKKTIIADPESGRWIKASELAKKRWRRTSNDDVLDFFVPGWLRWAKESKEALGKQFPVASRSTSDDLLGVHEMFYLVSPAGWLSRPKRKYSEGRLEFGSNFAMAVGFTSKEAALTELSKNGVWQGAGDAWVVKSSCLFTEASPAMPGAKSFDQAGAISAACEARDIRGALDQSAAERLEAMKLSQESKSRPASRL